MQQNLVIKWYTTIDSTNTQAHKEALHSPEGSVWFAEYQTNGRGQRGNKWESGAGENLTFTLLLKPVFLNPVQQFAISQVISVGICKYLQLKGVEPKIKWPNDIYIGNKKICGILIEHSISGDNLSVSICGIGLNLNQTKFSSDAPNPTSLALEIARKKSSGEKNTVSEYDLKTELSDLLSHILTIYNNLKLNPLSVESLHKEYLNYLYRFNSRHKFIEITQQKNLDIPVEKIEQGKTIEGKIINVDPYGCLVMQTFNPDEVKTYSFKEIKYII